MGSVVERGHGLHHDGRVSDAAASEDDDVEDVDEANAPEGGAGPVAPVDGRTARRDRNREAVLDATLALFGEGHVTPTAHQVAERSGVSLRSVYRYFEDREALLRSAIAHHGARIAPLVELEDPGEGPLDQRIERLVASRLELYGTIAAVARVASVLAASNPEVAEAIEVRRARLSGQIDEQFAPELAALAPDERARRAAVLDQALSVEGIEYLCARRDLEGRELAATLREALAALLR